MIVGLVLIAAVWAAGAVWSYREQKAFATRLGFHAPSLLPLAADGLPVALGAIALNAALDGRGSFGARVATVMAVGASVASNGLNAWNRTSGDLTTVVVACAVPTFAGIAFERLLVELRKAVLSGRNELPPPRDRGPAAPPLRGIRLLLDPVHEIPAWRRHVLAVTDPAIDAATRQELQRLVAQIRLDRSARLIAGPDTTALPETALPHREAAALPAGEQRDTAVSTETFEAPELPPVMPTETTAVSDPAPSRPALPSRSGSSRTAVAETSRSEMSRSASRSGSSRTAVAETAAGRDGTSRSRSTGTTSRRAEMTAWVLQERAEGRDPSGADLDREFGTRDYGRTVLRALRDAPAPAAGTARDALDAARARAARDTAVTESAPAGPAPAGPAAVVSGGGAVEADPVGSGERDATATTSDDGAGSAPAGPASVVSEPAVSEPAVSDSEAGELVGARS